MALTLEAARDAAHAGRCVVHQERFYTETSFSERYIPSTHMVRIHVEVRVDCVFCAVQQFGTSTMEGTEMEFSETFFDDNPTERKGIWMERQSDALRRRAAVAFNIARVEAQDE